MTEPEPEPDPQISAQLLEILVCPLTKGPLEYDREAGELISRTAGLAYPVRDGVPIMLADEARPLHDGQADGEPAGGDGKGPPGEAGGR